MDAASMFLEIGETSTSERVEAAALRSARRLAKRMHAAFIGKGGVDARTDLVDAAALLSDAEAFQVEAAPLLAAIRERMAKLGAPNAIYGVDVSKLEALSEDDLYGVLLDAYKLERVGIGYAELRPPFTLSDLLAYVWKKELVAHDHPDRELFSDHAYLATHVAYVLDDYSKSRLSPEVLGHLFAYYRREFPGVLAQKDLDLVAELVDLFRSTGLDDSDPMVCAGSRFILSKRRKDGTFSRWQAEKTAYDAIHPTWVAVDALRDRTFVDTPYSQRMAEIVRNFGNRN
jgi:hypothetical protein